MGRIDLGGEWRAAPADEHLRRAYPDPAFNDDGWSKLRVPGRWQAHPDFARSDGPVLYRRRFDAPRPDQGRRAWLRMDRVFYQSDIWLDGAYLADTEGCFAPSLVEVTGALRERPEHVLAMEVTCDPVSDPKRKRNLTGAFQEPDLVPAGWSPGGLCGGVTIEESGPVRILSLRSRCTEAGLDAATIQFDARLDALDATAVTLRSQVGEVALEQEQQLAAGVNDVAWQVVIERPALWWPHALGDQPLQDVIVDVFVEGDKSDGRFFRTGLRQVRMDDWVLRVNGERFFVKASNYAPTRLALGDADPAEMEHDVLLSRRANLDLLRVRAHIARPELYEAADRHGLLLWQDLPLRGGYARGVRKAATRAARAAVDLLAHHPSVAIWCAHDDAPLASRAVLDASVKRALERADGSRPVLAHSPTARPTADLGGLAAKFPRLVRFVAALGAGSFSSEEDQAGAVRTQVETLRRLKYRPTGGFAQALFADPAPISSASLLDHRRVPKLAYEALAAACAPVIVVADEAEATYAPGARVALDVHVVSDLRLPLEGVRVHAELEGLPAATGHTNWDWQGDIGPDGCVRVGAVTFTAPEGRAVVVLHLALEHEAAKATRRYEIQVSAK